MALSQAVAAPIEEILGSVELAPRNGFRSEPRCRVCRDEAACRKVNHMLASGASYAFIVRSLAEDNAKRDERDRVTVDSVRNHCGRHFPIQQTARATYREVLERRARENAVDFVAGLATALTPAAYFETVMVKGYETLVDPDTQVDVNTGMIAAGRLQALIESRASGTSMMDVWVKIDRIINAIKSTVPEEMWEEIAAKLDGDDKTQSGGRARKTFEPDDNCYDDDLDELDD
jgi:hypothetical protein